VTDTHDPWGPYRATIEDHLDTCGDYLDRLRRSLSGEIAPDRHNFADKAHELHTAARRLVRIVQDIDAWLGECTATIEHTYADGTRLVADCALPAGHHGPHVDLDAPLPGRQTTGELRDLADTVERISQSFGWTAPHLDRDLTGAAGTLPTAPTRSPTWPPASTPSATEPPGSRPISASPRPALSGRQ
jgi:hypothetical protein